MIYSNDAGFRSAKHQMKLKIIYLINILGKPQQSIAFSPEKKYSQGES